MLFKGNLRNKKAIKLSKKYDTPNPNRVRKATSEELRIWKSIKFMMSSAFQPNSDREQRV